MEGPCPFRIGQRVLYKPSIRGLGWDQARVLVVGREYVVEAIVKEKYIVVEGYKDLGGGIFWTEFVAAEN